jgi:hypothetical protein
VNRLAGARLGPAVFTLTALTGTWLAHGIEYTKSAGLGGLGSGLSGPLHGYMIPAGATLLLVSLLLGGSVHATLRVYRVRMAAARKRVALALRGHAVDPVASHAAALDGALSGPALWAALTASQIVLYVIQENVEAADAGVAVPGFGAIAGVHWTAPFIHAAVAAALTLTTVALRRMVRARTATLLKQTALLAAVLRKVRLSCELPTPAYPRPPHGSAARATSVRAPPGWSIA